MSSPKIFELMERDPRSEQLANNGQARIAGDSDDERVELRAELESFVCCGKFADAFETVLDRYLANLGAASRQDSVWVSGFFGSGKSHLLKMLAHLWANTRFDDGAAARSLVPGGLPSRIQEQLRELEVQAKRTGGPTVAAAGTMLSGAADRVRLAVLAVILRAREWPEDYAQARFCFWLRDEGLLDDVRSAVEDAGKDWGRELANLYVSPVVADALIRARPDFAADARAAKQLLRAQFARPATDIGTADFVAMAKQALGDPGGPLPLAILVLDEVQQYIGDSSDHAVAVTEVAEAVQTQFNGRLLLVAAGQSALEGHPSLQWLRDRFRITVQLSDAEVEEVTREVLLRKKPSAAAPIERMFEEHAGEVSRQLQGTKLGVSSEDQGADVADYPLLRTRRRFWEACFRAVAGTHSELRSQLRILHDSLQRIADRGLGAVIPASDLFGALTTDLVNSGVLLNEIATRIATLDDDTDDGRLRHNLAGVAFLVGKLPRERAVDLGVRADARTLADLLVDDVAADSGVFRKRVQDALDAMAQQGVLLKVADEYRIQTTAGAEWERALRERRTALERDEGHISLTRQSLLSGAVGALVAQIRLPHGESKTNRKLVLQVDTLGEDAPGDTIPVLLRDEWSCSEQEAKNDARRRGMEDPVLHVFLPKRNADDLRRRIVETEAARQVLDEKGRQSSAEGREARDAMKSRRAGAEARRDHLVQITLASARVLQGGGTEVFAGGDLKAKIEHGAKASLARLFPRFPEADHRAWGVALKRAQEGSDTPFQAVDWDGPLARHPVAKEALAAVATGRRGNEVRKALARPPFGWPRDAVDAALVALHGLGQLAATRNGAPVRRLDQTGIATTVFRPETVVLDASQRIALRGLFQKAGVASRSGEETVGARQFLDALRTLAAKAGGDAPLPAPPDTALLDEIGRLDGNEQLAELFEAREGLIADIEQWEGLARRARTRTPAWDMAVALRRHATGLPIAEDVGAELDAIAERRSLLDEMDPVSPCVAKLAKALREALGKARDGLAEAVADATARLDADRAWSELDDADRAAILSDVALATPVPLAVETDPALRRELDRRNFAAWRAETDAVSSREAEALEAATARHGEGNVPVAVAVRRATLANETDVRRWLDEHETKLMEAVKKGTVVVK